MNKADFGILKLSDCVQNIDSNKFTKKEGWKRNENETLKTLLAFRISKTYCFIKSEIDILISNKTTCI